MYFEVVVDNIKCGGCAKSIQKQLNSLEGVSDSQVNVEQGVVSCELTNELLGEQIRQQLLKLGYPESGSVSGVGAMGVKAKSYVSCAIGKMQKED